MMKFVFEGNENIGEKEKMLGARRNKCWEPAFSPFPIIFSKAFSVRVNKNRDCVVKN